MTIYSVFAKIYNKYWSPSYAKKIHPAISTLIKINSRTVATNKKIKILNLACGCGHLDAILASPTKILYGLDSSKSMLMLAKKNSPKSTLKQWSFGKKIKGIPQVDFIFCLNDSLNYVKNLDELLSVFHEVYKSLNKNGLFLFDVNNIKGLKFRWGGDQQFIIDNDFKATYKFHFDPIKKIGLMKIKGAEWKKSKWHSFQETHKEIPLEKKDVIALAKKTGFRSKRINVNLYRKLPCDVGRDWYLLSK